jgi:hypothetical protein
MINFDSKFQQNGEAFAPLKITTRESFGQFYSEVVLETMMPLDLTAPVSISNGPTFYVRDIRRNQDGFHHTLMPETWAKGTGNLARQISNRISAGELLSNFGVATQGSHGASLWDLSSSSLKQILNYVKLYGSAGGQGCFNTIGLNGQMRILSPQLVLSSSPPDEESPGSIVEKNYSIDWVANTPGRVFFAFYTEKGIEEEDFKITPGNHNIPITHYFHTCFIDNEEQKETIRSRFRNAYWYNYYTSNTVRMTNVPPTAIGAPVKNSGNVYMVWEVETGFTGGTIQSNYLLVSGP